MKPTRYAVPCGPGPRLVAAFAVAIGAMGYAMGQGMPFAVWENQQTSTYWFVRMDAATGVKTNVAAIPGMSAFVAGGSTAYDNDLNRYHVAGLSGGQQFYYTIDAASGNLLYSPPLAATLVGVDYNCKDSVLYGMRVAGNSYDLVTVDPATGSVASIAPMSGFSAYLAESFAIDRMLQVYALIVQVGNVRYLRGYDLDTGALLYDNLFPDNLTGIRYSCSDSSLYGLWENAGVYKLERVDVAAGNHATAGILTGVTPGFVGESASVSDAGYYTYRGFDQGNGIALISIDLSSASVASVSPTTDNAAGFEEAVCCFDASTSAAGGVHVAGEGTRIYPVPVTGRLTVDAGMDPERVDVVGPDGRTVVSLPKPGRQFGIGTDGWPAGPYVVRMVQPGGRVRATVVVKY